MSVTRPAAHELVAMNQTLRAVAPLSDADLATLHAHSHRLTLAKGASLLQAGQHASLAGYVISGGLREYYVLPDGTERTKGFNLPGELAGSLSDLLSGQPSRVWVTAEVPTELICTPWQAYRQLTEQSAAWAGFARLFAEALYMIKVEREFELLALDAAARYERALQRWPQLETLFTQRDVASYVGVTPVHLSRLRGARASASESAITPDKNG